MLSRRLLNYMLHNNPWEQVRVPREFFTPVIPRELFELPRQLERLLQEAESEVTYKKDGFQAQVDVQQFKPEEITVKVGNDNTVVIEGKHEEKQDRQGFISRHFVRKFILPEKHDLNKIESKLSPDGILTITAPKVADALEEEAYRKIPITQTDEAVKKIEDKAAQDKSKSEEKQNK